MSQTSFLTDKFRESVLERFYDQPLPLTNLRAVPVNSYYHNYAHIKHGFTVAENFGWQLTVEQELAWLFHDSVYIPGGTSNEIMSAKRMRYVVGETWDHTKYKCFVDPALSKAEPEKIRAILAGAEQIILDTIKHFPSTYESERVLDMDLFGLGGSEFIGNGRKIFNEYEPLLLTEYDNYHAVRAAYDNGRSAWATKFLERAKIYRTPECEYREETARKNLQSLIIKETNG